MAKYGGTEAEDAKHLKELEAENNRLERLPRLRPGLDDNHCANGGLLNGSRSVRLAMLPCHRPSRFLERTGSPDETPTP